MTLKVSLGSKRDMDTEWLGCPYCPCEYLHQEAVEVWFRKSEDDQYGDHVTVHKGARDSGGTFLDHDMRNNPSVRRDGIKIMFRCEECNRLAVLIIEQCKGNTYVYFDDSDLTDPKLSM